MREEPLRSKPHIRHTIGRKYIQRLAILRAADKFSTLWVSGIKTTSIKRKPERPYSITLTGNYRLIIEKVREDKVSIVDVEDYHGD